MKTKVKVIGAGLAGCEAAYRLLNYGIDVDLYEMRPKKMTAAHSTDGFAELVCSNSLKSVGQDTASGLLKSELRLLNSLILKCADKAAVPAGSALAVDRLEFSKAVRAELSAFCQGAAKSCRDDRQNLSEEELGESLWEAGSKSHTKGVARGVLKIFHEEVTSIDLDEYTVIAAGPLVSDGLAKALAELTGKDFLYFFDAAAPIVSALSIDFDKTFFASRYGKGDPSDYLNCPMQKDEYLKFYDALKDAKCVEVKNFEDGAVFEACMPVEQMAKRGEDTLRFGPLRPVGLFDAQGKRPYAVVQLRKENKAATMYNLVGFQTRLTFSEQRRVFSLIPGLENAEFLRYGVMHRNSFVNAPSLLDNYFAFKNPHLNKIYIAGQLSGVEGYVESAMSGLVAAEGLAARILAKQPLVFPEVTMTGALCNYITTTQGQNFQPMNSNFGLLPHIMVRDKKQRKAEYGKRAVEALQECLKGTMKNEE